MPNTATPILGLIDQANGENDRTWGDNADKNTRMLEGAIGGWVTITVTDGATATIVPYVDFSKTDFHNASFELVGALTAIRVVEFPKKPRRFAVWNSTTGGYAVTVRTAGTTGVSIPPTKVAMLACNGTSIVAEVVAPASSTGGVVVVAAENITGTLALSQLPVAASAESSSTKLVRADDSRLTPAGTIPAHTHTLAQITDAGTAAALNVGTSAGNVVQLNASGALPAVSGANLTSVTPGDGTITVAKLASGVIASQAQAEAGSSSTVLMSALGVRQAIAAQASGGVSTMIADGSITFAKFNSATIATNGEAAAGASTVKIPTVAGVAAAIAALAPSGSLADGSVTYAKLNSAVLASEAGAIVGASSTTLLTPQRLYQSMQSSAEVVLPVAPGGNTITVSHGLSALPREWRAYLICKTPDLSYNIGDMVDASATIGLGGTGRGLITRVTSTSFRTVAGSGGNVQLFDALTGDPTALNTSSWRIIYRYRA